ncbi:site-specific DNA-methyltransferase [Oceanivirga salmonicida]|uniref:site-specific DNA-methyltransferase n=1 Tax=Oceanivirga salmonicida TaxID=1769291 RepID=UPI0012E1C128|nr:site-specific DNA-methyltransferase [Oceanivirga salmonicida]
MQESYEFTWVGKNKALLEANIPTNKTLRPCIKESKKFETTENLYIEGDNLEVLKILQESYLGKIKMIYIDPPYNTGRDFIYNDNFTRSKDEYDAELEITDEEGNRLIKNTDSNGRFHSDWCSMIYSRLLLARNLLTDDGIIFISIDENEINNMMNICNDVFSERNYIENFVWIKNSTKNLSKTTSTNHEYILCYAKNKSLVEEKQIFRIKKPGLGEVEKILKKANKENWTIEKTEEKLKEFYKSRPDLKGISMYNRVENKNVDKPLVQTNLKVYTIDNLSAPKASGKAAMYDVIHPITKKICKIPTTGWRFKKEKMQEHINNGNIYFYEDETKIPRFKRFLDTVTTEVVKSTFENFKDGKKELMKLFDGEAYFENSKPTSLLTKFISFCDEDSIILDFFSGSATTAHAVMNLNSSDGGNRKFIMVQLPEVCEEKSEAYKSGYKNICEIGKERIRRAGKNLEGIDTGFRVFKLATSNMKNVYFTPDGYTQDILESLENNIKEGRNDLDLLFECLLDWGITLSNKYDEYSVDNSIIHSYNKGDLVACFSSNISMEVVEFIAKMKPIRVVFRDSSFKNSSDKINVEEIFKMLSPDTSIKVL